MTRRHLAVFFGGPQDGRWFWATGPGRGTLMTPERSRFPLLTADDEPLRPLRVHEYESTPVRTTVEGGGYAVAYVYRRTA